MSSVYNIWTGKCDNREVQEKLCNNLKEIAELSNSFFKEITPVQYFDHAIKGRIIIEGALIETPIKCSHIERITKFEGTLEESLKQEILLSEIFDGKETLTEEDIEELKEEVKKKREQNASIYYIAKEVNLHGFQFRLYDERDYDTDCDSVSFVFAQIDSCSSFNGLLVLVEDRKECLKYKNNFIKTADYYLSRPEIHLRYYNEGWMRILMGYVQYFYIPNLYYYDLRYERGSTRYYDEFLKLVGELDEKEAKCKVLNILRENL